MSSLLSVYVGPSSAEGGRVQKVCALCVCLSRKLESLQRYGDLGFIETGTCKLRYKIGGVLFAAPPYSLRRDRTAGFELAESDTHSSSSDQENNSRLSTSTSSSKGSQPPSRCYCSVFFCFESIYKAGEEEQQTKQKGFVFFNNEHAFYGN